MRQVIRLGLGNGTTRVRIYRVVDAKAKLVDVEYTNSKGILRWTPPSPGMYNFTCDAHSEYNVIGYVVENNCGWADGFICPVS